MALVNCPSCSKRISSKAAVCSHCNSVLGEMSEEQRLSLQRMKKIETSQSIMTQSMIAMLLFCGGFGSMFWGEPSPHSWQYIIAAGTTSIGFIWYVINRIRLILLKRK